MKVGDVTLWVLACCTAPCVAQEAAGVEQRAHHTRVLTSRTEIFAGHDVPPTGNHAGHFGTHDILLMIEAHRTGKCPLPESYVYHIIDEHLDQSEGFAGNSAKPETP